MMCPDLIEAKKILLDENLTCVFCKGGIVFKSRERGIKPLLDMLESHTDTTGFSVSDKVIGTAAALLYCLMGVKQIHAHVMSRGAVKILQDHCISVFYDELTETIQNRKKTGLCPMEIATQGIVDPDKALSVIKRSLDQLRRNVERS